MPGVGFAQRRSRIPAVLACAPSRAAARCRLGRRREGALRVPPPPLLGSVGGSEGGGGGGRGSGAGRDAGGGGRRVARRGQGPPPPRPALRPGTPRAPSPLGRLHPLVAAPTWRRGAHPQGGECARAAGALSL